MYIFRAIKLLIEVDSDYNEVSSSVGHLSLISIPISLSLSNQLNHFSVV